MMIEHGREPITEVEVHATSRPLHEILPIPWRLHRCRAVHTEVVDLPAGGPAMVIQRCPCGGSSLNGGPWVGRNIRRMQR